MFAVEGEFPRLTPYALVDGKVPAGVLDLSYQIDLSGPAPKPLEDHDIVNITRRFAG